MHRQSYPVSQAMTEMVSVTRFPNHRPGQIVAFRAGHTRTDVGHRGKLCAQHDVIHLAKGLILLAQDDGAADVAAVAAHLGPHIDHYRLAQANHPVGGPMVGHGGVGAGGDNCLEAGNY